MCYSWSPLTLSMYTAAKRLEHSPTNLVRSVRNGNRIYLHLLSLLRCSPWEMNFIIWLLCIRYLLSTSNEGGIKSTLSMQALFRKVTDDGDTSCLFSDSKSPSAFPICLQQANYLAVRIFNTATQANTETVTNGICCVCNTLRRPALPRNRTMLKMCQNQIQLAALLQGNPEPSQRIMTLASLKGRS